MFKGYQPKKGYDEYFSSDDFLPRSSSKSELVAQVRGSFVGPHDLKSELEWNIEIT